MSESKTFENEHVRFEMVEGVIIGTFKEGPVTLDIAKMIVSERIKFSNGKSFPLLITDVGLKSIKKEAREFLSSDQALEGIKASGMVAKSFFTKHMANFFVKINVIKPKIPTRIFTDEDEAIKWLKQYL